MHWNFLDSHGDLMIKESISSQEQKRFQAGFEEFDRECEMSMGNKFDHCTSDKQNEILNKFEKRYSSSSRSNRRGNAGNQSSDLIS